MRCESKNFFFKIGIFWVSMQLFQNKKFLVCGAAMLLAIFFGLFSYYYSASIKQESIIAPVTPQLESPAVQAFDSAATSQEMAQPEHHEPRSHQSSTPVSFPQGSKPFLKGFSTLGTEFSYDNLPIEGFVPDWLAGQLFFVGPAKFEMGTDKAQHWLDGFSMLHRFSLQNGCVSYKNKFLNTAYLRESSEHGVMSDATCACDPKASYFSKLATAMSGTSDRTTYDNANINVIACGDRYIALTQSPHMILFDPNNLNTKAMIHFNDMLATHSCSSVPVQDPHTREWFGCATTFGKKSFYTVYTFDCKTFARTALATIPVGSPSYMQSCFVTQRYVAVVEVPFVVSAYDLVMSGKPYIDNFVWKHRHKVRIHVVERSSGDIVGSYTMPPFFTLNYSNAYEEGDLLHLDYVSYPDATVMKSFYMDTITDDPAYCVPTGTLTRTTIDLSAKEGDIKNVPLLSVKIEMPTMNKAYMTSAYRYVYGLAVSGDCYFNTIIKSDVVSGQAKQWSQPYCYPSEAVFIARPNAQSEDDGVLVSVIFDASEQVSSLVIIDAKDMNMLARVRLSHSIPFLGHGMFVPNTSTI